MIYINAHVRSEASESQTTLDVVCLHVTECTEDIPMFDVGLSCHPQTKMYNSENEAERPLCKLLCL